MHKPRSRRPSRKSLRIESLEDRVLLAVAPIAAPDAGSVGTVNGFNAPLVVSAAGGLLANDSDPDLGDVITFRFQGTVSFTTDADFTTGDTFVGTYSFRASATDVGHPDSTLNTQYPNSSVSFEIYFPAKGYRFTGNNVTISVGNNTTFGDRYIVSMNNPVSVGASLPSGRTIGFAQFDIQDPVSAGQNFLANDSIQTRSPDISLAANRGGRLVFTNNDHVFLAPDQLDGPLQVTAVNGNAAAVGQTITLPSGASLTVRSNGAYTYDPSVAFAHLPDGAVASDSFTYRVTDIQGLSSTGNVSLTISGDNNAPGLTGANNFTGILDSQAGNMGNLVSDLVAGRTVDADQGALSGIAVTSLTTGGGSWEYSTDAGSVWTPVGTVSSGAALLLRAQDRLRFVPIGLGNASVTFRAWDQTSGSAGSKVAISQTGGTTAFSTNTATANISVTDDDGAPPLVILGGSTGTETDGQNQVFTWDITDASGIIAHQITVTRNGSNILTQNFPNSFQNSVTGGVFNFNSHGLGTFVLTVSATDADNDRPGDSQSSTASRTVTVTDDDMTPPTLVLGGSTGTVTDAESPFFTWNSSDASGVQRSVYFLVKNGVTLHSETFGDPSGTFGGIDSYVEQYGLGTYEFIITALDDDNDWDSDFLSTEASRSVTVIDDDTAGPAITLGGSLGAETDDQNQVFTWDITDASGVSARQVSITRNGGNIFAQNSTNSGSFDFNNFGPGEYVITVSATDADSDRAGDSLSSTASRTVTVTDDDTDGPVISLGGSSGSESSALTQSFSWDGSDASGLSDLSVVIMKDGTPIYSTTSLSDAVGSFNFDSYGVGTYSIALSATDADSDWGLDASTSTASRTVTVTNTPPVANAGGPYSIAEGTLLMLDASGSNDVDLNIAAYEWDLDYDGVTFDPDATGVTPSVSFADNFAARPIAVRVTDSAGASDIATTTLTVLNVAPQLTLNPIAAISENGSVTVTGAFTDAGALDTHTVMIDWGDGSQSAATVLPVTKVADFSVHGGGTLNSNFFASEGLVLTSGSSFVNPFFQSDQALVGIGNQPATIAGNFSTPVSTLSVRVAPGSQGTATYTLSAFDDVGNLVADSSITVTQDTGDPANTGFGYFTVDLGVLPTLASSFTLQNSFVRSSFTNTSIHFGLSQIDFGQPGRSFTASKQYLDDNPTATASDVYTVGVTVTDDDTGQATASTTVTVNNVLPQGVVIDSGVQNYVFALGTPMTFSGQFSDVGTLDTHTAIWTFSHLVGTATIVETRTGAVTETGGSGTVANSLIFDNDAVNKDGAGVYTVTLTVTDDDTGAAVSQESRTFVVYDASEGFVTGGGWINSPAGAYTADPSLTGKATFGFNSKYQKGANVPTGETEFQFKVASLNFHSSSYEWLVVAGARAQYKGLGAINGTGDYAFMLTAIDGQVNGGGGVDKFRIKIWDRVSGGKIYDNQPGANDDATPTTVLGGGQIVIQKDAKGGNGSGAFVGDALDAALAEATTPRSRGFAPTARAAYSATPGVTASNTLNLLDRAVEVVESVEWDFDDVAEPRSADESAAIDSAIATFDSRGWRKMASDLALAAV